MKKIIFITLFYVILGHSQKCKFEKNEVDEFTKKEIVKVKGSDLFRTSLITGLSFQVSKIDGEKFITFAMTSGEVFSLEKGESKIMIKTVDEKIINIDFLETIVSEIVRTPSIGTICYVHQTIPLTDDLIKKLTDIEVLKIRVYTNKGYVEESVKKKNSKNISNNIKCL